MCVHEARPQGGQEPLKTGQDRAKSGQERPRAVQERFKSGQEWPKSGLKAILDASSLVLGAFWQGNSLILLTFSNGF